MIVRHEVSEVTIELGDGAFTWQCNILGELTTEKVIQLLDEEIEESGDYPLNELGVPSLVDLHKRYRLLVADFRLPVGAQRECKAYGEKVGTIYVVRLPEVIQIEGT